MTCAFPARGRGLGCTRSRGERARQAAVIAAENVEGVKKVHDHLCWVDTMSGVYLNSPEDDNLAKAS